MGTLRSLIIAIFCFIIFSFADVTAQDYYPNDANTCGTEQQTGASTNPVDYFGGWYKPARSDVGAPTGSDYFPILVVFINFQNEPDISGYGWHANGTVDFIDSVISYDRENYSEWWNSYNHYQVSDYWHEFSRGKLHPLGQAISITLPHAESWYAIDSNGRRPKVYKDVYDALIALGSQIYWPFYDRWKSLDNGSFSWESDGRVDMMYLIFRHDPIGLIQAAEGYMPQNSAQGEDGNGDYLVYNNGGVTVKINSGYGPRGYIDGSGLVVNGRTGFTTRDLFLEVATHEHGHYLFGDGHITYSKMAKGAGREFSLSPWESIKLGYIIPKDVNYSTPACTLGDISSRYGSAGEEGNIIEIPVGDEGNDIFLIANRQKVSEWDRRMAGDTVPHEKGYLKNINPEYGKGLYIYHVNGGFYYSNSDEARMDMECADGLWNWEQFGYGSPDWDQNEIHPAFRRLTVSYAQDNPDPLITSYNRDGLSLCMSGLRPDNTSVEMSTWYSIGKPHEYSPKVNGTDKLFTNETGTWYSLETAGDRWDAWKPGDKNNEVFSPYSSPNTNTWENDYSGLFIYLSGMTGTDADIKIYRVGHGGYNDEMQILEITPPSKPMGIRHDYYYPANSWCVPQIIWNHNMEPDMEQVSGEETFKRYLVYRATAPDMSTIPNENNYVMIEQVDIPVGVTPHYEDLSVLEYQCAELDQRPPYGIEYPVRYRVRAVDKFEDYSVLSDFVSTTGINQDGGIEDGGDNPRINSNMPKEFNLSQNYPNPFNPVTKINFAIPKSGFVTLKIYDILGREIKTLVNEVKQPGYYTVDFNGSALSSGIYFYRIAAGNFTNVKRMVLIK